MKLVSFNVNSINAILAKDFKSDFEALDADIFAIQETKLSLDKAFPFNPEGYEVYYTSSKVKKGYAGTAIFTKIKPLSVHYGLENGEYDDEGRVTVLEFEKFYFVTVYSPNSQDELRRLEYRLEYERKLQDFLAKLDLVKPVILCGDLNVAHQPIDIKRPKANEFSAGYSIEERNAFSELLASGFKDTFRELHPDTIKYSWWSYLHNARKFNSGWRLDYFIVSSRVLNRVKKAEIHNEVFGSDHCPVSLEIDL